MRRAADAVIGTVSNYPVTLVYLAAVAAVTGALFMASAEAQAPPESTPVTLHEMHHWC